MSIINIAADKAATTKKFISTIEEETAKRNEKIVANGGRIINKIAGIDNDSYKLLMIPNTELFGKLFVTLPLYNKAVTTANEAYAAYRKGEGSKEDFTEAKDNLLLTFGNLKKEMQASLIVKRTFQVLREKCIPRANRRSLASDIAGVIYDNKVIDQNIVMVNHDAYNQVSQTWMLAETREDSLMLVENVVKNMLYLLQVSGIDIVDQYGHRTHYEFWASTSSHQKKGIAYFGETNMMKRTEELRNFACDFNQLNMAGGDNGAEYIKRQAILFTPSTSIDITLNDVLMLKDVERTCDVDNVAEVDLNTAEIKFGRNSIDETLADGQAFIIDRTIPSFQGRGYALKFFAVQSAKILNAIENLPGYVEDIDGNQRRIRDYKLIATKSCWKANKLGYSWEDFVAMANRLSEQCSTINKLRVVRYADSANEKTRYLSRQSTQQWIYATEKQIEKVCSESLRKLNKEKKLSNWLIKEAGMLKDAEDRLDVEDAYMKRPDILASTQMEDHIANLWNLHKVQAAANKLKVRGQYPYLAHDPVGMLQILLCNADPNTRVGFLSEGEINCPNLTESQKAYFVRYPNNFLCGMILTNRINDVYSEVGNVAILSVNGHEITRADGDFDGDEALVVEDAVVINMMQEVIDKINPPLIKFAHSKAARHLMNAKQQRTEIAIALYNGQAYNKVGQYSNNAMKLMATYQRGTDFLNGVGLDVIRSHVATILVIDMVKTGTFPVVLQRVIDAAVKKIGKPYSQKWIDAWKGITAGEDEYESPAENTPDMIGQLIEKKAGEFEYDREGVVFQPETLLAEIPENVTARRVPKSCITPEQVASLKVFNAAYHPIMRKIANGEAVGAKGMMEYFFFNRRIFREAMQKTDGKDASDLSVLDDEYCKFVHDFIMNMGTAEYWLAISEDVRRRIVYNAFIKDAFEMNACSNGIGDDMLPDEKACKLQKACYARFIVQVFAKELVEYAKEYKEEIDVDIDAVVADMNYYLDEM